MQTISISILNIADQARAATTNELMKLGIKAVHYDVMDGIFVPQKAITLAQVKANIAATIAHDVEIHLMVAAPENYIEKYKRIADAITFHFEAESYEQITLILKEYAGAHFKKGLAINPGTKVTQIYQFLPWLDSVLIMAVVPGQGGQKFLPTTFAKIRQLRDYIEKHNFALQIQVDGGINAKTGPQALAAGAHALVSGTYLTNAPTKSKIAALKLKKI